MPKKSKASPRLTYDESLMGWTRRRRPRRPTMDSDGDQNDDGPDCSHCVEPDEFPTELNVRDEVDGAPYEETGRPEE
jgi:hypothetical protein